MMKLQESGENYLETILVLRGTHPEVHAIDIAAALGFSKPSVSRAVHLLKSSGYLQVNSAGCITLTESGEAVAQKIYERHRLLTQYLMALGVREQTAKEDACRIEHVISEESFAKLKEHASRRFPEGNGSDA